MSQANLTFEPLPPLPEQRQRALIARAQAGDQHALNLAVQHNVRMVLRIANKYFGIRDHDDIVADGLHGLAKAILRFDLDKGFKFSTYAWPYVQGYILDGLNKGRSRVPEVHLDKPISRDSGASETGTLLDLIPDPDPLPDEQAESAHLRWQMVRALDEHLTERQAEVIKLYYGIGTDEQALSQKEIAERMEISPGRVHEIVRQSHVKLHDCLSDVTQEALLS